MVLGCCDGGGSAGVRECWGGVEMMEEIVLVVTSMGVLIVGLKVVLVDDCLVVVLGVV